MPAMQAAVGAHRAGRLPEAIQFYRQALKAAPRAPEIHYNLGVALKNTGQARAAEKALTEAVRLRPAYALAHSTLADFCQQSSRGAKALRHRLAAYRADPNAGAIVSGLVTQLGQMRFSEADPRLLDIVTALLLRDDVEGQRLAGVALSLLSHDANISFALQNCAPDNFPQHKPPALLLAVLERTIVAAPAWERLLTQLRSDLLTTFDAISDGRAPLVRALAAQMLATDYAYLVTAEDAAAVKALRRDGDSLTAHHVRLALFGPLKEIGRALSAPPDWSGFVDTHMSRPLTEQATGETIERLTPISDSTSLAVQDQYTALPYPRWLTTRGTTARPRSDILRQIAPQLPVDAVPKDPAPLKILVAGCGTGKHAVDVATRFANADVLAIDLSLPSLGYAKAQAARMGQSEIRFGQADILTLGRIDERFAHIEAMGVLHHLAEPLAGWQVLRGLLAPGGTMRIGLYSRRGRGAIRAAQSIAAVYPHDSDGLRELRQAILALPEDHPAAPVRNELDFYTLNGVRDALAHAQEHDYTVREIADLLDQLDLQFLGFEFALPAPLQLFHESFGPDHRQDDLTAWDRLEQEHPELFHHMYQFWCKPANG